MAGENCAGGAGCSSRAKGGLSIALAVVVVFGVLSSAGCTEKETLIVFHAGSLSGAFASLAESFEKNHTGVEVHCEASGSVDAIRKVTDLGKAADIVASADYRLINTMMIEPEPHFAGWNVLFASNSMVLLYTQQSAYSDEINSTNWYEILARPDVVVGFSDPNADPCGYRALMVTQLAEKYYGDPWIFENVIGNNTAIWTEGNESENNITIHVPPSTDLNPAEGKILIKPKAVDLMSSLELGEVDYVFEYLNVAVSMGSSGIKHLAFPEDIDLSSMEKKEAYSGVTVSISSTGKNITAYPIVYGFTIPTGAPHHELAVEFAGFLLGDTGREIIKNAGFRVTNPPTGINVENMPPEIASGVEALSSE